MGRYVPVGLLIIVLFVTFFPATIEVGGKDLIFFTEVTPSGLPSWVTLPLVFIVIAITMTGLGEITGRAFREFKALDAYRWDIIGSILGTLAVHARVLPPGTVLGLAASSPSWPCGPCTDSPCPGSRASRWSSSSAPSCSSPLTAGVSWSPYYKVTTETFNAGTSQEFMHIQVNGIPHQNVMDVDERLKVEAVYGKPYERASTTP